MAEPIPFTVTRYRCPHCTRTASKKAPVRDHIGRCWRNPANRTCRTCSAWTPPDYFDDAPQECRRAITLPAEGLPVVGCPLWTPKDTANA